MTEAYDFGDPQIRRMVDRDHTPGELWGHVGRPRLLFIQCDRCHEGWPCGARKALTAWLRDQRVVPPDWPHLSGCPCVICTRGGA